jgi:hypothetical protein
MQNIAPDFIALMDCCSFQRVRASMIPIGTLLALISRDLVGQLECRRYFSVTGTLFKNDLVKVFGDVDDSSNIVDERVYLNERYVRFILGDNNVYSTCFRYIRQERSNVDLAQVIMPDTVKEEIVRTVGAYFSGRDDGRMEELDGFFGYGTGLAMLFYGPSGTGKTMLAKGLAAHFNRPLFSFVAEDRHLIHTSTDEILGTLFREAALHGAIVFLDECDDVFANDGSISRSLLIEIEKARCVVIMATNKPVSLDPALERRISRKVHFTLPEPDLRLSMWQSLLPQTATLAAGLDLAEFAERYQFSGGLIRNSIFLALTDAAGAPLTPELLHAAARLQTASMADERMLCRQYTPDLTLDELSLRPRQRLELKNMAVGWGTLKAQQDGLAIVITSSDIAAGVQAANALARDCGLRVRSFNFNEVISLSELDRVLDPVTQRKVLPLDYAFARTAGDQSMTLFVDHDGMICRQSDGTKGDDGTLLLMHDLVIRLRRQQGLFCLVTNALPAAHLPPEINICFNLEQPTEEAQLRHWESLLGKDEGGELVALVEQFPLHLTEIDYLARQARILATVRRRDPRPTLVDVDEVIARYRRKRKTRLLFGTS